MKLVHTLLFMIREKHQDEDIAMAQKCLKSLESAAYPTVVIYNQGFWAEPQLKAFLAGFNLNVHIVGEGINVGTSAGRQMCFEYVWKAFPDCEYISELHLDMMFPPRWEDALTAFLDCNDEPMICSGIVDSKGNLPFLEKSVPLPEQEKEYPAFLASLCEDKIVHGFTNPCIHVSAILKAAGGYHTQFLKGSQCFEDDSMLLGYYYYYGTRLNWQPKVNGNTVVFHAVAGQRLNLSGDVMVNFQGLNKQYGLMGLSHLSELHKSPWHKAFFKAQYRRLLSQ